MKRNSIILTGILVIGVTAAGAIWYVASNRAPSFSTIAAARGDVVEAVDEASVVHAENDAALSFQVGGQIAHVYVKEGNQVTTGALIADLSNASYQAAVAQANAALQAAQAKLDSLRVGTRPEQIAIDQAAVMSAQSSLGAVVSNAYTAADDAIHNQTDNLFANPKSNNPTFLVNVVDSQQLNNIQSLHIAMEEMMAQWYMAINASSTDVASLAALTHLNLTQVQSYLDLIALPVNNATPNSSVSASTLASYKANVVAARAEISAAVTSLTNASAALTAAQNVLALAEAGSTAQDIAAQQAVVAQDQAAVAAAQVGFNNTSLVAPFAGTVENLTAQVGQVVSPGAPVVSLVNNGGLKIVANVSQADVAKIAVGDKVRLTLDSFGAELSFPATVAAVSNAQTLGNGSTSYLVTMYFTAPQSGIRDGMTGNAHIVLAEHDEVVIVPSHLVIHENNQYFVLVSAGGIPQERSVQIGLVGDAGATEIISGISEGEVLINY